MFGERDLETLIDLAGVRQMASGWQVVIRAEWVDASDGQPHGLSYALILQDALGDRIMGFDNAHSFDGAAPNDPWDHEHKPGRTEKCFPYKFVSAAEMISDFFERLESYCLRMGVSSEFNSDE